MRGENPEVEMYRGKKIVVVMPAYNAAQTLRQTYDEVREQGIVDEIILVDDRSRDDTVAVARSLEGVQVHVHERKHGLRRQSKDLLPARARKRARTSSS